MPPYRLPLVYQRYQYYLSSVTNTTLVKNMGCTSVTRTSCTAASPETVIRNKEQPLKISISIEALWEARLDQVLYSLDQDELNQYLQSKPIGSGLNEIFILLVCRQPMYKFKQRIRHSKKNNVLSLDLMLDLPTFMSIDNAARRSVVASKIIKEVPTIVKKYKFKDVDTQELKEGFAAYFSHIKWISDTAYNTSLAKAGQ